MHKRGRGQLSGACATAKFENTSLLAYGAGMGTGKS